jgi:hypothetical protein
MECDSVADTPKAISYFNQQVKISGMLSITYRHYIFQQVTLKSAIKSLKRAMVLNNFKSHSFYTIKLTQVFIFKKILILLFKNIISKAK